MASNITKAHKDALKYIQNAPPKGVCLFSCFVNGAPTSAICSVEYVSEDDIRITPLFVAVTADMIITDHDGVSPNEQDPSIY